MSLKDKINNDLKEAIKSQNHLRIETIRSIRAEILKMDKSGMNREMNEEEEIALLNKQAKMRKESIELFEKAGRTELVEHEKAQLHIIEEYLPKQASLEEVNKVVADVIANIGSVTEKDFGKVMGMAMKGLKGKADGKLVQAAVKAKLGMN